MPAPRRRLQPIFCALALCLLGLWYAGSAIMGLARTAIFVHEAAVVEGTVVDVRQKPFDNWEETLGKGNLAWPGDVSYQPIVNFTMPSGLTILGANLDADVEDYHRGQTVSIIVPRDAPGKAQLYRWKFLWGGNCLRLLAGALLLLPGWHILKTRRPARREAARPAPARKQVHNAEEPFTLTADAPAPRRRRKAAADRDSNTSAPRKPRTRKKSPEGATPAPKRRKPRSKAKTQA